MMWFVLYYAVTCTQDIIIIIVIIIIFSRPASRRRRFTYVTFLMSPLSFDNGWKDRNADYCVNAVDEKITMAKIW